MKMTLAALLLLLLEGCQDQQIAANCEQQLFAKGSQYDCSTKPHGLTRQQDEQNHPEKSSRSAMNHPSRDL